MRQNASQASVEACSSIISACVILVAYFIRYLVRGASESRLDRPFRRNAGFKIAGAGGYISALQVSQSRHARKNSTATGPLLVQ